MTPIKTLTEKEFRKINFWLENDAKTYYSPGFFIRNELLIRLLLDAGLRVGEAVQLKWHSILTCHLANATVVVNEKISKSKQTRTVPMTDKLVECVQNHYKFQCDIYERNSNDFVFSSRISRSPISTRQVHRIVNFAFLKAIGKVVHPHMLRHTFATRLMRVTNSRIVQELLGHKKLTSTQIYTHPNSDDLKKAIDKMDQDVDK